MINIVICDDDVRELHKAKELCHNYAAAHRDMDIHIEGFNRSADLQNRISEGQYSYDIWLLDIYMQELSGVELARSLRELHDNSQIVFITSSREHAIEAFSLHATHYLVKPYTKEQLESALNKAVAGVEKARKSSVLLKTSDGYQKVKTSEIIYSETNKHIQMIHLQDGSCLQVRMTCGELYEQLSGHRRFYKYGSTYIINLEMVRKLTTKRIFLDNGEELLMQRRKYRDFVDQYMSFLLEE